MNKLFKAMFCVTFFSVSTRALGFLLKIYLSRNLSNELLGSYQVAMSIFAVFMTLVSSGIPVVLSRNVSYFSGQKDKKSIGSLVSAGIILTGVICFVVSLIIFFCPKLMNAIFASNASTEMLVILIPALISSAIYEVIRGALWGEKEFFEISFSEFLEQIVRIVILVVLFKTTFINMSLTNKTALSLSLAYIFSTIHVLIIYFKKGGRFYNPKPQLKSLIKTSTPITAVKTASSIVTSVIAIIIPLRLMKFGYSSSEALSEFGIIMGMTFPLIMIPSTLIGSLAVTIIPSISEQSNDIDSGNLKDTTALKSKINFAIKLTIIFSTILLSTFIALGIPLCEFIYKNSSAGTYLCFAAISMLPLGLSQISSAVLNAVGLEMKSLKNYAISAGILILCIYFLPKYIGTYSLIVGYLLMSTTASLLNFKMLSKRNLVSLNFSKTIIKMLSISLFSTLLTTSIYHLVSRFGLFISLTVGALISVSSTAILIYIFNIANIKVMLFRNFRKKTKVCSQ